MTKLQNNHKSQSNLPRQISAPLNASSAQLSPILPAELIAENIEKVRKKIAAASENSGRRQNEIKLMLAAKYQPGENLRAAIAAGATLFGHNMVQQLQSAESEIADFPHTTTMIGHVQSNKLSAAMDFASRIDTVDSLKLAQRIARRQAARIQEGKENAPYPILLQVNSSGSESQFGCEPTALIELANKIIDLPELKIEGVMTIGAHTPEREAIIRSFELTRKLSQQLQEIPGLKNAREVSMGMSADLDLAIASGSTLIRIGTAIFGARPKQ